MSHENPIDKKRRRFLLQTAWILSAVGACFMAVPWISSFAPSRKVKTRRAPLRVDLSRLAPGEQMTVLWQGKPLWILHRTPTMLAHLKQDSSILRDPHSWGSEQPIAAQNNYRSIKPEYLVMIGLCTHLGCVPHYESQAERFLCPCHGSIFDLAGRVYKNMPAPINLAVPPYRFISEHIIEIGRV